MFCVVSANICTVCNHLFNFCQYLQYLALFAISDIIVDVVVVACVPLVILLVQTKIQRRRSAAERRCSGFRTCCAASWRSAATAAALGARLFCLEANLGVAAPGGDACTAAYVRRDRLRVQLEAIQRRKQMNN